MSIRFGLQGDNVRPDDLRRTENAPPAHSEKRRDGRRRLRLFIDPELRASTGLERTQEADPQRS